MQDGFIKVAAASPRLRVGDPGYNTDQIIDWVRRASVEGVRVLVFPQLCITGYTCGDLFFQQTLLDGALAGLRRLREQTEALDMIIAVGLPVQTGNGLYNCAALLHQGRVLGLVPKYRLEDDCGLAESRYFSVPQGGAAVAESLDGAFYSPEMTLGCTGLPSLRIGVELGGNGGAAAPPSAALCARGATLILNLAAGPEAMDAPAARREQARATAGRLLCGYVSAGAGMGESTTDHVYSGHCLIAEGGDLIAEAKPFSGDWAVGEVDVEALAFRRRRSPGYPNLERLELPFDMELTETSLSRVFEAMPFVPNRVHARAARCEHILNIQGVGLKKRMEHIGSRHAVIGISGGLDSTLALMAVKRAYELMELPLEDIRAYTMPCFGTSRRTRSNAEGLCAALGIPLKTIDITEAVRRHFADIGQDEARYDAAYENAQARERTQVLMDIANQVGGLVIGPGDLSELALGWTTYNGDHMSMYAVNSTIPKTLVRDVVGYLAESGENEALTSVLSDILDTPVSPELVPGAHGDIGQKTEDLVGDYRLHDFFLYHFLTRGCGQKKLYRMACRAFEGVFDGETVDKWLRVFMRRFFSQQYKRSCMPDGPGVTGVSLSPRGGLLLPSDSCWPPPTSKE